MIDVVVMRARFLAKTRLSACGCIEWTGARDKAGYGLLAVDGKKRTEAHRIAWFLAHGEWSRRPDRQILHSCDNRLCVNVDHMRIGTQAENIRDRQERGRQARGERQADAKLDAATVAKMREMHRDLGLSRIRLGEMFGVSARTAWAAVTGVTWPHIGVPPVPWNPRDRWKRSAA